MTTFRCAVAFLFVAALGAQAAEVQPASPSGKPPAPPPPPATIAVLELKSLKEFKGVDRRYLSDLIRQQVKRELPKLTLMSRENILLLLSTANKSIDDCEAECEVETGRRLGADLLVTPEMGQVDGEPRIVLKLFDTRTTDLVDTQIVRGVDIRTLEQALPSAVASLLSRYSLGTARPDAVGFQDMPRSTVVPPPPAGAPKTLLSFESDPPGAVVFVDSDMTCAATPCSREITRGDHTIRMQKEGYEPSLRAGLFRSEKPEVVKLDLEARFATVTITTVPDGLTVRINDRDYRSPIREQRFDPGEYQLGVIDRCFQWQSETLVMRKGAQAQKTLRPKPRLAGVAVHAIDLHGNALAAEVSVAGQAMGWTPIELTVPSCTQAITATTADGRTATERLSLEEGKSADVTLSPVFIGPTRDQCDNGVAHWPYWVGAIGGAVWGVSGGGALIMHAQANGLPAGDPAISEKVSTGKALMIASNVGGIVFGLAALRVLKFPDKPRPIDPRCEGGSR